MDTPKGPPRDTTPSERAIALQKLGTEQQRLSRQLRVLIISLGGIAVVLTLMLAVFPGRIQSAIFRMGQHSLEDNAKHLAHLAQSNIEQHLQTVRGMAQLSMVKEAFVAKEAGTLDQEQLRRLNAEIARLVSAQAEDVQGIFLCHRDLRCFSGVLQDGNEEPYRDLDISGRKYAQETLARGQSVVSDPLLSHISSLPIIALTAPVRGPDDRLLGFVGMSLRIDKLSTLISSQSIGESGYPFAIDNEGRLVSHPDPQRFFTRVLLTKARAETLVKRMRAGETGSERYTSSLGIPKIAAFAPVPIARWSIGASIDIAEFESPAQHVRLILLSIIATVFTLGACTAITLHLGGKRLRGALESVRSGELKIAEQAALIDQTRDCIIVLSPTGIVNFWNKGAESALGWTSGQAIGEDHALLLGMDPMAASAALETVLARRDWHGRLSVKTRGGERRTLDCRWTLLRQGERGTEEILAIGTDITERELAEERNRSAQRMESLGTLAGGVAHDLNNMLSPVLMGVDLLRESVRDEKDREVLNIIEQSANHGAQLVQQVLTFSRGKKGSKVSVQAELVLREISVIMGSTLPKSISFKVAVEEAAPPVLADPIQLGQVLMNLCINARDAMPQGGTLRIKVSGTALDEAFVSLHRELQPGAHLCIEVSDTGFGIPPEILPRIFDPFFSTKAPGKGTGLGLSTVLGIIREHKGGIYVYSEPGKGTVFRIYLPAHQGSGRPLATKDCAPLRLDGRQRAILFVDDEEPIRTLGARILGEQGFKVMLAESGRRALAILGEDAVRADIALVITDVMMPELDGLALIQELSRPPMSTDMPPRILAMSGLIDEKLQHQLQRHSVEVIPKPLTPRVLLAAVGKALGDAPQDGAS